MNGYMHSPLPDQHMHYRDTVSNNLPLDVLVLSEPTIRARFLCKEVLG
jgi:hypothetical protein